MSKRSYILGLAVITLLAWALRLAVTERFVGLASPPDPADGLDQLDYELFAYRMSQGLGYTLADGTPSARRAPGTSLVILPVYWLLGRSYLAARLWITALSALTCWAAAWVVRPTCGAWAALLTAAGVAVNPGLFYYAIHLWSEAPFCLFVTLATGFSLRSWKEDRPGHRLAAGLCWGLACLTRPQVLFMAPFLLLAWCWADQALRRRLVREVAWQSAIVVILAAPWVIRNYWVLGKPTMATLVGSHTFWGAHNDRTFHDPRVRGLWITLSEIPHAPLPLPKDELAQERVAWNLGLASLRNNWQLLPQLAVWKLYRLLTPFEDTANRQAYWVFAWGWIVTIPWLPWGWGELARRDPSLLRLIALQIAATVLCTLVFYGAIRFRHALEPQLMMLAAMGMVAVYERWLNPKMTWTRVPSVPCLSKVRAE